nr:hypothetical protein [Legionella sp.]
AMSSISYTLNTGRSHYPHRGVWIAEDSASLQEQLSLSLDHKTNQGIFIGVVDKDKKPDDEAIYENVLADTLGRLKTVGNLDGPSYFKTLRTLGNLYVKGYAIDWEILHQDEIKQRMSLPTYPFAKERYWITSDLNNHLNPTASNIEANITQWEKKVKAGGICSVEEIKTQLATADIALLDASQITRLHTLLFPHVNNPQSILRQSNDEDVDQIKKVENTIRKKLSEILKLNKIDDNRAFQVYGLDSITSMHLASNLSKTIGYKIQPQSLIDFPTVVSLARHLTEQLTIAELA